MQNATPIAPRYFIAAPGCTLARRATYFHRVGGTVYLAQSARALAALLASRGIA